MAARGGTPSGRAARPEMARCPRGGGEKSGPVGEMDLVAHWRRVRLPKVLEFVFVVDRRGVPART